MKRAISILLSLLVWTSMQASDDLRLTKVVIDPGHGGHDPGAISQDRKSHEKALTLDISKRLAALIQEGYPDVNVKLTRTSDSYVTLEDRASKANDSGAQLFISIHINAARNTSASGYSVHVLGQSSNKNKDLFAYNMDVCKRENSVVMLEEDYSTKYQGFDPNDPESYIFMTLMQNANLEQSMRFAQSVENSLKGGPIKSDRGVWQNPFLVLWRTSMPAVLVELGFISNSSDLAVLRQSARREEIATRLYEAFKEYKTSYEVSLGLDPIEPVVKEKTEPEEKQPEPEVKKAPVSATPAPAAVAAPSEGGVRYGIQIMAATTRLPDNAREFLGYEATIIKGPKFYKYILSISDDLKDVKKNYEAIKKKYPQCFLVKIEGEEITRISK